jgi:hypothetical protein
MATIREVVEGLNIMLKYDPAGEFEGAAFDVIYGSTTQPDKISAEDTANLKALGWYWDKTYDSWIKLV